MLWKLGRFDSKVSLRKKCFKSPLVQIVPEVICAIKLWIVVLDYAKDKTESRLQRCTAMAILLILSL